MPAGMNDGNWMPLSDCNNAASNSHDGTEKTPITIPIGCSLVSRIQKRRMGRFGKNNGFRK
jgi:hypothetical protein